MLVIDGLISDRRLMPASSGRVEIFQIADWIRDRDTLCIEPGLVPVQ